MVRVKLQVRLRLIIELRSNPYAQYNCTKCTHAILTVSFTNCSSRHCFKTAKLALSPIALIYFPFMFCHEDNRKMLGLPVVSSKNTGHCYTGVNDNYGKIPDTCIDYQYRLRLFADWLSKYRAVLLKTGHLATPGVALAG